MVLGKEVTLEELAYQELAYQELAYQELAYQELAYQELVERMDRERRAYGTLGFLKPWRAYFRRSGRAFLKGGVMLRSTASLVNLASRDRDDAYGWG